MDSAEKARVSLAVVHSRDRAQPGALVRAAESFAFCLREAEGSRRAAHSRVFLSPGPESCQARPARARGRSVGRLVDGRKRISSTSRECTRERESAVRERDSRRARSGLGVD